MPDSPSSPSLSAFVDIARLREWARTRTRPASAPQAEPPGRTGIV